MKLTFFDDYTLGVFQDEQILDASKAVAGLDYRSPQELLEMLVINWTEMAPKIQDAIQGQTGKSVDAVSWCPPVPRPSQLVCAAVNYIEPDRPNRAPFNAFIKATSSIIGNMDTVELPPAKASVFHFEPELALVIGKRASHISAAESMDHVFGYTPFMDVSSREMGGFFLGKSWHTCGPLGPMIVTADEISDPNQLNVKMHVNDTLKHDFSTNDMTHQIPELLSKISEVMVLNPGDVVATGTHHQGLAPVQDGDQVRLQIEGLGPALVVNVHDSLKRSW